MKNKINVFGLKKIFISLLLSLIFFWNSFAWNDFLQKKAERIIDSFSERVKKENPSEEKQIIIYRNIIATINKIKVKFSWDKLALLNFLINEINKKWELLGKTQTPVLTDYNLEDKNNDIEFDNDSNSENPLEEEKQYSKKLLADAQNFSNEKEYDKAIKKYLEYLEINEENILVYYNLLLSYYYLEDYSNCIKFSKKYIQLSDKSYIVYNALWVSYYKIKEYKKAIEAYKKALYLKSDYKYLYKNLFKVYKSTNKKEEKIFYYIVYKIFYAENIDYNSLIKYEKKIYDLEYKRIKKYIDEKKFDKLRDYALKKYLN